MTHTPLHLNFYAASDRGLVRANNEDSAYAGPHLLVIADGMGGHAAGEVASQLMIDHMRRIDADPGDNDMLAVLASVADDGNRAIAARIRQEPETDGMGTTLTALMFDGTNFGLCHVGDSRGYLLRDGKLVQITRDDTFVQSLVDSGDLDAEDVSTHPKRSLILKAYTGREVEPTLEMFPAQPGDRVLLCSDGLSDPVTASTIEEYLAKGTPREAAEMLISLALRSGGPDNVTLVIADVVAGPTEGDQPLPTVPMVAGAPNADTEVEDPRPDTAAGRAAMIAARQPQTIPVEPEPTVVDAGNSPARKRSVLITAILAAVVLVAAGGFWAARYWANDHYFLAADSSGSLIVHRGANGTLSGMLSAPYQQACLDAEDHLTLVGLADENCEPLTLNSLPESLRSQVDRLPAGSYDDVVNQVTRLANDALPVCVTRTPATSASSAPTTSGTTSSITTTPSVAAAGSLTSVLSGTSITSAASTATTPADAAPTTGASETPQSLSSPGINCREVRH